MVVEIIRATPATATLVAFLRAEFAARSETATVGTRIREPRPAKFVKVRLMGGSRSDLVRYGSMLTIECWAGDEITAEALGSLTEALIVAMPDLVDQCTRVVDVGGLVEQPDPDSGSPRYVFTKMIYLRSTVLV